jgi:hypothetical protein
MHPGAGRVSIQKPTHCRWLQPRLISQLVLVTGPLTSWVPHLELEPRAGSPHSPASVQLPGSDLYPEPEIAVVSKDYPRVTNGSEAESGGLLDPEDPLETTISVSSE